MSSIVLPGLSLELSSYIGRCNAWSKTYNTMNLVYAYIQTTIQQAE